MIAQVQLFPVKQSLLTLEDNKGICICKVTNVFGNCFLFQRATSIPVIVLSFNQRPRFYVQFRVTTTSLTNISKKITTKLKYKVLKCCDRYQIWGEQTETNQKYMKRQPSSPKSFIPFQWCANYSNNVFPLKIWIPHKIFKNSKIWCRES